MNTIHYRRYRPGDEESINAAFNQVFILSRSLEEWRWKFRPDRGGSWLMLALDSEKRVTAQFGAVRVPVQVDGRLVNAGQTVDVFCLPSGDAPVQRIYLKTARRFYEEFGGPDRVELLIGFPSERPLRLGRLLLRYADPLPVVVWRRPAQGKRTFWKRYRVGRNPDLPAADGLWKSAAARYPVSAVRNGAWLRDRYLSRPGGRYEFRSVHRRGKPSAWAVLSQAGAVLQWVDLLWDGQDARALAELDEAAGSLAIAKGCSDLEMWMCSDARAGEILRSRGWKAGEHPQRLNFSAVSFRPEFDANDIARRFYVTLGDSDLA